MIDGLSGSEDVDTLLISSDQVRIQNLYAKKFTNNLEYRHGISQLVIPFVLTELRRLINQTYQRR